MFFINYVIKFKPIQLFEGVKKKLNNISRWMILHMFCAQGITDELGVRMSSLNKFISYLDIVLARSLNRTAGPRKGENSEV
jgi:hypothetical protein